MSLRLSKEHGVNPSIPTCFFCGKPKNEIILFGASYHGQAPMHCGVVNHEPCDECKSMMDQGVMLVSVQDGADQKNPYRTGKMCVIKTEAAQRIFNNIGSSRFAFIEDTVWKMIGLPSKEELKETA